MFSGGTHFSTRVVLGSVARKSDENQYDERNIVKKVRRKLYKLRRAADHRKRRYKNHTCLEKCEISTGVTFDCFNLANEC